MKKNAQKSNLLQLIPIGALTAVLSQANLLIYYSTFNFNPLIYFEPYDIILGSLKDFIVVAISVIILLQITDLYLVPKLFEFTDKSKSPFISTDPNISDENFKKGISVEIISLALILLNVGVMFYLQPKYVNHKLFYVPFVGLNISIILATFELRHRRLMLTQNKESTVERTIPILPTFQIMALSLFLVFMTAVAEFKHDRIINHNPYKGSMVILETDTVKCTSKVLMIGKSRGYYFFYNTPDSSIRIVNRQEIKKEVLKFNEESGSVFFNF